MPHRRQARCSPCRKQSTRNPATVPDASGWQAVPGAVASQAVVSSACGMACRCTATGWPPASPHLNVGICVLATVVARALPLALCVQRHGGACRAAGPAALLRTAGASGRRESAAERPRPLWPGLGHQADHAGQGEAPAAAPLWLAGHFKTRNQSPAAACALTGAQARSGTPSCARCVHDAENTP